MLVEQELCRKLVDIFAAALTGVDVQGNWLPSDDGGFKGEPDVEGSVLHVRVSPRSYDSYTDKIAEFKVELEGTIRVEEDTDMTGTFVCCAKLLAILTGWQNNIAAVKRDLGVVKSCSGRNEDDNSALQLQLQTTTFFDPVGYRMDPNGDLDIETETLTRKYNQSFTLKGRIH